MASPGGNEEQLLGLANVTRTRGVTSEDSSEFSGEQAMEDSEWKERMEEKQQRLEDMLISIMSQLRTSTTDGQEPAPTPPGSEEATVDMEPPGKKIADRRKSTLEDRILAGVGSREPPESVSHFLPPAPVPEFKGLVTPEALIAWERQYNKYAAAARAKGHHLEPLQTAFSPSAYPALARQMNVWAENPKCPDKAMWRQVRAKDVEDDLAGIVRSLLAIFKESRPAPVLSETGFALLRQAASEILGDADADFKREEEGGTLSPVAQRAEGRGWFTRIGNFLAYVEVLFQEHGVCLDQFWEKVERMGDAERAKHTKELLEATQPPGLRESIRTLATREQGPEFEQTCMPLYPFEVACRHQDALQLACVVHLNSEGTQRRARSSQHKAESVASRNKKEREGRRSRSNSGSSGKDGTQKRPPLTFPIVKSTGATCLGCGGDGHHFVFKDNKTGKWQRNCPKNLPYNQVTELQLRTIQKLQGHSGKETSKENSNKKSGESKTRRSKGNTEARSFRVPAQMQGDGNESASLGNNRPKAETVPGVIYAPAGNLPRRQQLGFEVAKVLPDTGSDRSLMPAAMFREVLESLPDVDALEQDPSSNRVASIRTGSQTHKVIGAVRVDLALFDGIASHGHVLVNAVFLVIDDTWPEVELIVGQDIFTELGIDGPAMLFSRLSAGEALDIKTGERYPVGTTRRPALDREDALPNRAASRNGSETLCRRVPTAPQKDYRFSPSEADLEELDAALCSFPELGPTPTHMEGDVAIQDGTLEELRDVENRALAAGMPASDRERLHDLLHKYPQIWRTALLPGDEAMRVRPWREPLRPNIQPEDLKVHHRKRSELQAQVLRDKTDELEAAGFIEPFDGVVDTPQEVGACAPAMALPKSTPGAFRMVFDLRAVNALVLPRPAPIPHFDELHSVVSRYTTLFSADIKDAFWQLPLDPDSQRISVLEINRALYTSKRVLQGCLNSPAALLCATAQAFGHLRDTHVWYMDDILSGGKDLSGDDHFAHLEALLQACATRRIFLNPRKFVAWTRTTVFLGRQLLAGPQGVVVDIDPDKKKFILNMQAPGQLDELETAVGVVRWIGHHLPAPAQAAIELLTDLKNAAYGDRKRRNKRVAAGISLQPLWTKDHDAAWDTIRRAVAGAVPLGFIDSQDEACLYTDASLRGWSACMVSCRPDQLALPHKDRRVKFIAWIGGAWRGAERNYGIPSLEMLAIVKALKKLGFHAHRENGVHVYCDHKNVIIASNQRFNSDTNSIVVSRLVRWSMFISQFNVYMVQIAGEDNWAADVGSRLLPDIPAQSAASAAGTAVVRKTETFLVGGREYAYGKGHRPATLSETNILPEGSRRTRRVRFHLPDDQSFEDEGAGEQENDNEELIDGDAEQQGDEELQDRAIAATDVEKEKALEDAKEHGELILSPQDQADDINMVHEDWATYDEHCFLVGSTMEESFEVPDIEAIKQAQDTALKDPTGLSEKIQSGDDGDVKSIDRHQATRDRQTGAIRVRVPDLSKQKNGKDGLSESWWIPSSDKALVARLVIAAHAGEHAHQGTKATLHKLRQYVWSPKLKNVVKDILARCVVCAPLKVQAPRPEFNITHLPAAPNAILCLDFAHVFNLAALEKRVPKSVVRGAYPYAIILVDAFSKFIRIVPAKSLRAPAAVEAVLGWVGDFGPPTQAVVSDRGPHFTARCFREMIKAFPTAIQMHSLPYAAFTNGVAERSVGRFKHSLRAMLSELRLPIWRWERMASSITLAVNSKPVEALGGRTPIEVHTGRAPQGKLDLFLRPGRERLQKLDLSRVEDLANHLREYSEKLLPDVRDHLREARRKDNAVRNKSRNSVVFEVGDYVLYRRNTAKTGRPAQWVGPAQVIQVISRSRYLIRDILTGEMKQIHASRIVPCPKGSMRLSEAAKNHFAYHLLGYSLASIEDYRFSVDGRAQLQLTFGGFDEEDEIQRKFIPMETVYRQGPLDVLAFIDKVAEKKPEHAEQMRAELALLGQDDEPAQ